MLNGIIGYMNVSMHFKHVSGGKMLAEVIFSQVTSDVDEKGERRPLFSY